MKRILLVSTALALFAGAANAADLSTKMPLKALPPVTTYNWDGFYAGGFYGSNIAQVTATTFSGLGPGTGDVGVNQSAFVLGLTGGYNWRVGSNLLVGLEGDIAYSSFDRSFAAWSAGGVTAGSKADWLATARARFGYLTGPSLLYVTGGAAFVNIKDTFGGSVVVAPTTNSTFKTGWTAGGGIETKLSQNWSSKTEYLYVDAGSTSFTSAPLTVASGTTFDHQYHIIKSGLSYAFGGPNEGLPFFSDAMLPSNHNWSGFYAGVNAGVGISTVEADSPPPLPARGTTDINGVGFTGGVQLGYNYFVTRKYFVGVEGDFGYLGINQAMPAWIAPFDVFTVKTNWYGTARARLGTSTGPALLYITGGAAWVNLREGFASFGGSPGDVGTVTASGWTVGGGTEVALDARWSARLESLYIDVGKSSHNDTIPPIFFAEFKRQFTVVRAGLNYQIGPN